MIQERNADWHIMQFVSAILVRSYCYGMLTLFTLSGIFHFFALAAITPLLLVSRVLYRNSCTFLLRVLVPGILCVPVSWRGVRVHCNGFGRFREANGRNLLVLSNHAARIDWFIAQYMGWVYGERVGFITEAFIMFLPFFGWFRFLVGDMYVLRSFKRDKERLDNNISSFHETDTVRWIVLCPEGHIADFGPADEKYISDCEEFSAQFGHRPFSMVLTPRYKGMLLFNKIMTRGIEGQTAKPVSVTLSYVQNGQVLTKPLRSAARVIPDLWTMVKGDMHVYAHLHILEMSNEAKEIKDQFIQDYADKDKLLRTFFLKGRFPAGHPDFPLSDCPENWKPKLDPEMPMLADRDQFHNVANLDLSTDEEQEAQNKIVDVGESNVWQTLAVHHLEMNVSLFCQMFTSVYFFYFFGYAHMVKYIFFGIYSVLAVSHITGEFLAGGHSRESVPLEGLIKGIVFRWMGREGAGAKDKVLQEINAERIAGATSREESKTR